MNILPGTGKVKKNIFSIIALLSFFVHISGSKGQSTMVFDAGQMFSTYYYKDAQGVIKDFSNNITGCYSLGYHYITNNGLFIRTGISMRKGGASLVYNGINTDWTTQYADINLGAGYMVNKWRVKPYFSASPYFAYMLKGEQTLGQNKYDIKQNKSMKTNDIGVYIIPGLKVALTNYISFYVEYKYLLGLSNIEVTPGQQAFNRGFSLNLGIAVTFIRYNYVTTR
jgi:hypothetical protein